MKSGEAVEAAALDEAIAAHSMPFDAIVHIPVGLSSKARTAYKDRYLGYLDYSIYVQKAAPSFPPGRDASPGQDEVVQSVIDERRQAHLPFVEQNVLSMPLRSGLDLGRALHEQDRFLIAHYILTVDENGRLERSYLDDPALFPPALAHVDLQYLTEPIDPLLYTGGGRHKLTLGNVGAPVLAVAPDPHLENVVVTSDELEGRTLIARLQGAGPRKAATVDTETFNVTNSLYDRQLAAMIVEALNEAGPALASSRASGWLAYYGFANAGEPVARAAAEAEAQIIRARNDRLLESLEVRAAEPLSAVRAKEAGVYDRRRELAAEETEQEIRTGLALVSFGLGMAAGAQSTATGAGMPHAELQTLASMTQESLDTYQATTELSDSLIETTSNLTGDLPDWVAMDGGVDTALGKFDLTRGLAEHKAAIRERVRQ